MVSGPGSLAGQSGAAALRAVRAVLTAAGCPDAGYDAVCLVQAALNTKTDPRLCAAPLDAAQAERLAALTARRAAREPLQYILGRCGFMGLTLAVGPGVLCPRPDSETVAETAIALLRGVPAPAVLDLCAGSGCLGLAVQRFVPAAAVTCVEKDPAAFRWLLQNTAGTPVRCVQGDVFTWHRTQREGSADLIVCNPPYLTAAELAARMPETAAEPAAALDGGADGLVFYRALLRDYRRVLRPGGWLVLEIGAAQGPAVRALAAENGWQGIACRQDLAGHDRAVTAQKPPQRAKTA